MYFIALCNHKKKMSLTFFP
uniref:Uncharacterized protein n=1 Tax=Anguilla anguilla TaxID=7936 RepID=A0A0E9VN40_ANGAN